MFDSMKIDIPRNAEISWAERLSRTQPREALRRGEFEIVAIHPRELFDVEDARTMAHVFWMKAVRQLVERQDFLPFAGRPPNQREIVRKRLW